MHVDHSSKSNQCAKFRLSGETGWLAAACSFFCVVEVMMMVMMKVTRAEAPGKRASTLSRNGLVWGPARQLAAAQVIYVAAQVCSRSGRV